MTILLAKKGDNPLKLQATGNYKYLYCVKSMLVMNQGAGE